MIDNLAFRQKIWLLPLGAAAVFAVGVAVSFAIGSRTAASLEHLAQVDTPTLHLVQKVEADVESVRLTLQAAVAEGDPDKLAEVLATVDKTRQALKQLGAIEESRPQADKLAAGFERYQASALAATRAMLSKGDVGNHLQQMQQAQKGLSADIAAAAEQAAAAVSRTQGDARQGTRMAQWTSVVTGLSTLLLLGLVSVAVTRSVWHDLGEEPARLKHMVREIAAGNLAIEPEVRGGDQRSLNAALAQMLMQLRGAVNTIRLAADSINTSSSEIAQGSQDLSRRTETTASNLQSTASSVALLTDSVGHSSQSARQASDLAGTAATAAQHGGNVMGQVVSNMQEIDTASRRIAEITGVIDSIAFQTNILALNAAVEAARAGDQGRGFAVVASEVRTLASRSAEAAREIRSLIGSSVEKVESGARLVNAAGTAMDEIVAGVSRVTSVVGEISASAQEQSSGISQVNDAVSELDRMTQQNAALVEQSAAAAESMREQAVRLGEAVAIFRTTA